MSEYFENQNDQISIGEIAKMFNISCRKLRLYHEMGLLIPQYVNDENGYRYYSRNQFPLLEKIIQMKSLGLSLKQIKAMINGRNLSVFEALLSEHIDNLSEKISEDYASRDLLVKQLNSCAHLRNPPVLNSAFIEFIPERFALAFDIEPYDLRKSYQDGSPWEKVMAKIKGALPQNNLSPSLIYQTCCTISQHALLEESYLCSGALLLTEGVVQVDIPRKTI